MPPKRTSSQRDTRKRSKLSQEEDFEPDDIDEEDDDQIEAEEEDGGEYESEEEAPPRKKRKQKSQAVGDVTVEGGEEEDESDVEESAGTLSYILLENFMCHDKLELHFHRRITIINGPNGSGKSAILTGIQTCLGAKTSDTHRGASLKDLIKTGRDWSQITLKIRNKGGDAFKHDQYGDNITVIRRIDKYAASSYKIKSASGKTVSTTYKELKQMLDQFNMQIDNPTTVMTQDVSREFLANSSASKKYQFFEKATQLEKMTDEYGKAGKVKWSFETALKTKYTKLEESEADVLEAKRVYEEAKELESMETQIGELQSKTMYAILREKQREYKRFEDKVKTEEPKVRKLEEKMNSDKGTEDEYQKRIDVLAKETEDIKPILNALKEEISAIDKQIIDIGRRRTPYHAEEKEYEKRIERHKQSIKAIQKEIKELQEKSKIDRSAEIQKIEAKIEGLRNQLQKAKSKKEDVDKDVELREQENRKRNQAVADLKAQRDNEEKNKRNFESQAANLERQKSDKMLFFVNKLPLKAILQEIWEQRSRFKKLPIGPIGLFVTIKEMKWAAAIENALRNDIHNFICDNSDDQRMLHKVINHVMGSQRTQGAKFNEPSIIVQKYRDQMYNIEGRVPSDEFKTILDMIQLDEASISSQPIKYEDRRTLEATIKNVLINQSHVETTVLVEKDADARSVMFQRFPRHVENCFTVDCTRYFMRGKTEVLIGSRNQFSKLWAENKDEIIQSIKSKVAAVSERLQQINEEGKKASVEKKEAETQLKNLTSQQGKLQTEIHNIERKIRDAESERQAEEQNETAITIEGTIERMQRSIEEKEAEIKEYQETVERAQQCMEKLKIEEATIKEQRSRKMQEQNDTTDIVRKKGKDIEKILREMQNVKMRAQEGHKMLAKAKEMFRLLMEKFTEVCLSMEEAEAAVKGIAPVELDDDRSSEDYAREQDSLKRKLQQERKRFNDKSVSQIKDFYDEKQKKYDASKRKIDLSRSNYKEIEGALETRYDKWLKIRNGFHHQVSYWFNAYMSQKGHSGSLVFDNEKKELKMQIKLDTSSAKEKEKIKAVEDTKSLSGGERSFSTVAFLLSLWQVIESPLRALDEFDIFMDAMYRKLAMEMVINEAEKKPNMQLIILTPHDTSAVPVHHKDKLKLVKLRPPLRDENQRTMEEFMSAHAV
jgi:chromosome segregation ATPase